MIVDPAIVWTGDCAQLDAAVVDLERLDLLGAMRAQPILQIDRRRAAPAADADRSRARRRDWRAGRSSNASARLAHRNQAARAQAARNRRGWLRRGSQRSLPSAFGCARSGRARPRTAPTATDTAHPRAARTIQTTRVQSARRGSHPPCSRRRVRARRPEIPPESWFVSMTGAGKLSPGPQPVTETRPRSHSRASRARLLRYAAPTAHDHPQEKVCGP